ncbi:MAG: DEAD/DEAH box helicase [Candidatus Cloacimonetes bacterium]|nr:DEAD/DEAH box helicase [Candidatus Cloacimonadota bacterium]
MIDEQIGMNELPNILDGVEFVAIDLETTGLDSRKDEIIEIAAVRFAQGKVTERLNTFVKPRGSLPKYIEILTHITPQDLKNAPRIGEALSELLPFLEDAVLVGHNVRFDLDFLDANLVRDGRLPLANPWWDTSEMTRIYLPFTHDHKLITMTEHFQIPLLNAHRAIDDAEATGHLMCRLINYVVKHFPLMLNARILDIWRQAKKEGTLDQALRIITEYQRRYSLVGAKVEMPSAHVSNVIEHKTAETDFSSIDHIFGNEGSFSRGFSNYEIRPGQIEMANHVDQTFLKEEIIVVEAGTGVGKSFAYLVPAIRFANLTKRKVIVSTNTKNLQEQLFYKDLPQLKEVYALPFKAVLIKGRENYICERRWQELLHEQVRGLTTYEADAMLYLIIWKQLTSTGDISENSSFDTKRFSIVWRKLYSDRYMCLNRKCAHFNHCYVMSLRKHTENASIVVTNHSLLLSDLKSENASLGSYDHLVIDEAHNLTHSASRLLGFDLGYADLTNLYNQLCSSHRHKHSGFIKQLMQGIDKSMVTAAVKEHVSLIGKNIEKIGEDLRKPTLDLFSIAYAMCEQTGSYGKLRIKSMDTGADEIIDLLKVMMVKLKDILKDMTALSNVMNSQSSKLIAQYDILTESLEGYILRLQETEGMLLALLNPNLDDYTLWIENNPKPERNIPASSFCYAPIEVNKHLKNLLYDHVQTIVFTSATLALRGSFKYYLAQSGLNLVTDRPVNEVIAASPFDFDRQSRLMVASYLPEHQDKFFLNQALSSIQQIITATRVGTMALFTSYKDLNAAFDFLADSMYQSQRPLLAQGKGGGRSAILKEFKRLGNAVLLGTNSFWEGIDVQGESLSLLILFKLPFQVPSEPVVEAYIDKLDRENLDSFMHFMLPNALLKLRQGFGRLIRSKTDTGIVLILDSRVSTKKYGTYFKQILPTKCIELKDEYQLLSEVTNFFNRSNR